MEADRIKIRMLYDFTNYPVRRIEYGFELDRRRELAPWTLNAGSIFEVEESEFGYYVYAFDLMFALPCYYCSLLSPLEQLAQVAE